MERVWWSTGLCGAACGTKRTGKLWCCDGLRHTCGGTMTENQDAPKTLLPRGWSKQVRAAVLHVISLAQYAAAYTRGWAADIPRLARDLRNELPEVKGFSERNIKLMLAFFREYRDAAPIVQQAVAQLPAPKKVQQPAAQLPFRPDSLLCDPESRPKLVDTRSRQIRWTTTPDAVPSRHAAVDARFRQTWDRHVPRSADTRLKSAVPTGRKPSRSRHFSVVAVF
jgi:hypothetical protein